MEITFYKYQGTGNDFVMIDNRSLFFPKDDTKLVGSLCNRRFGIGADGLILLEDDDMSDFRMVYFNSDGNPSSMCGNGGRCIVAFAKQLGIIGQTARFIASDGVHEATIGADGTVSLHMKDVGQINQGEGYVFLDTGSPHHIEFVNDLSQVDVPNRGAAIRYGELYGQSGSNVNFVKQETDGAFSVRTYERGVEGETLSCGTGVTAVAIAAHSIGKTKSEAVRLNVEGGSLEVTFKANDRRYTNVCLIGPANYVFKGTIEI